MLIEIKDHCIRCGLCEDLYPEIYQLNFEKDAIDVLINTIPESMMETVKQSVADCAVTAIYLR